MSDELQAAFTDLAVATGQLRVEAERWYDRTGDYSLIKLCDLISRLGWSLYKISSAAHRSTSHREARGGAHD